MDCQEAVPYLLSEMLVGFGRHRDQQHRARSKCSVTVFEIEQSLPSLSEVVDLAYVGQNARRLTMGSRSLKHSIVRAHMMYKGCPNCHS